MTVTSRIGTLGPRQRHILVTAGAIIVLIALAIPFGLSALRGGLASGSGGSSAGSTAAGVAPVSPGGVSGSRDAKSALTSPEVGAPAAPTTPAAPDKNGAAAVPTVPKLARTAWLGVKVHDLLGASVRVRQIALSAGGQVIAENIVTGVDPTGGYGTAKSGSGAPQDLTVPPVGVNEARLTLSVPADRLDGVVAELSSSALGTLSYQSSQSEDVTDTYVDTQARIQPAKDSIDRVRALLVKATSLDQIVMLESELSRRQADLDSLEQRLAELDRRTTMSQVSVTFWTDATAPVVPEDNGFVDSLKAAWRALLASLMVVVTGLAVMLPWLGIALAVAWAVRRWLRRHPRPSTPAPGGAPTATAGPGD